MVEDSEQQSELVSIAEASRRLSAAGDTVDRSSLSRYLKQHAEALPLVPRGKENLVDFEALAAHRRENIRIRQPGEWVPAQSPGRPSAGAPAAGRRFAGSQSDGAARKVQAEAEMRELDLAERRGELTPTTEVDKGGREAIALMQSAFDRAVDTDAAAAAVKYGWDERVTRIVLKAFARHGIEMFNREILDRLDAMERQRAAGDGPGPGSLATAPLQ